MRFFIPKLLILAILLGIFFVADICSFFWLQAHASYLLFSFLICCSWYSVNPLIVIAGSVLMAAQALVINQGFFIPLFAQLTILALLILLRERLYLTSAIPPIAFMIYLLATTLFWPIDGILYPLQPYTMVTIFGNLTAIGIFSLKLKTSRTRQSLVPMA